MLTDKERLTGALTGIKIILNKLGYEDIKIDVCKDEITQTIDCYKEIENYVSDLINIQEKFGVLDIKTLLNSILDIDIKSENTCFPVRKKVRILTDEDYDKLNAQEKMIEELQNKVDHYKHEYFSMCDLIENPKAYTFEQLHEGMWVWDDMDKQVGFITIICKYLHIMYCDCFRGDIKFEEDRFFPITKALQYHGGLRE